MTRTQYIRCVKPNSASDVMRFDDDYVTSQLKACGVVETIEICKTAMHTRLVVSWCGDHTFVGG